MTAVAEANRTVVHISLLPGAVEDYHAAIARATSHSRV